MNPRVVVFGEDVGRKGGVHAATLGLQEKFGVARVFDTSLSEEGIIGRAVGMAAAGFMPVPEIQFRKYADPAAEQLNDCGTMRWRTANRFAAPMVVRIPGGFFKCGDPWHSQSNEVQWVHGLGWRVAMPSNAAGCGRPAARGAARQRSDHILRASLAARRSLGAARLSRAMISWSRSARRTLLQRGDAVTVVTWGAMVERCELAIRAHAGSPPIFSICERCRRGTARRRSRRCARPAAA